MGKISRNAIGYRTDTLTLIVMALGVTPFCLPIHWNSGIGGARHGDCDREAAKEAHEISHRMLFSRHAMTRLISGPAKRASVIGAADNHGGIEPTIGKKALKGTVNRIIYCTHRISGAGRR